MPIPPAWNDEVETLHKTAFPDLDVKEMKASWERSRRLAQVREEVEAEPDKPINEVLRNSIPGVSAIIRGGEGMEYSYALKRFQEGKPEDYDYRVIAAHEKRQRQHVERGSTLSGAVGQAALHAPAFLGEMAFAGGMIGAAAPAAPAAPGIRGAIGAGLKQLVSPRSIARTAAEMPAMPSMWAEQWSQANMEAGRDPADVRGMAAAMGLGIAQMQVLKAVGAVSGGALRQEGLAPAIGRVGISGASGPFAQAAADVTSYGLGLQTSYGTIEQLVHGDPQGAARAATVQALTFAAFHAAHEPWQSQPVPPGEKVARPGTALVPVERRPGTAVVDATQRISGTAKPEEPIRAPAPVMKAFRDALNALKRQGHSEEGAARRILAIGDRLRQAADLNPALTRQEARALFEGEKHTALRDLGMAFADVFPDVAGQLPPPPGMQGPFPDRSSVSQRPVTDPSVLASMEARGRMVPEAPQAAPEPPQTPAVAEPAKAPPQATRTHLREPVTDLAKLEAVVKAKGMSPEAVRKTVDGLKDMAAVEAKYDNPEKYPLHAYARAYAAQKMEARPPAPESPVLGAVVKSFPDARSTPRGEIEAEIGGRKVYVNHDAERNVTRIDFEGDKPGVPAGVQKGSVALTKGLLRLAKDLAAQGVGIEYRAVDTNRETFRTPRADLYAKHLKEAGYEQVSEEGGVFLWRPKAETPAPAEGQVFRGEHLTEPARRSAGGSELPPREPTRSGTALAEGPGEPRRTPMERLAARVEAGENVEIGEVFDAARLTAQERRVLELRMQGRTLEEIGADPGVTKRRGGGSISKQAVEQIEKKARAKLGANASIHRVVTEQEARDRMLDAAALAGEHFGRKDLPTDPQEAKKLSDARAFRETGKGKQLLDVADRLLEAAERAEQKGEDREAVQRAARLAIEDDLREIERGRAIEEEPGQPVTGTPEGVRRSKGTRQTTAGGEEPQGVREGSGRTHQGTGTQSTAERLNAIPAGERKHVKAAVQKILTEDMTAREFRQAAREFGLEQIGGLSRGRIVELVTDRLMERPAGADRSAPEPSGNLPTEAPKSAELKQNPQDREEYLRDVIAVMRGNPSPNFSPDQAKVKADAEARIAGKSGRELRKAIDAAEAEWQKAKEAAQADYEKWLASQREARAEAEKPKSKGLKAEAEVRRAILEAMKGEPVVSVPDLKAKLPERLRGEVFDKVFLELADSREITVFQDIDPAAIPEGDRKSYVWWGEERTDPYTGQKSRKVITTASLADKPLPGESSQPEPSTVHPHTVESRADEKLPSKGETKEGWTIHTVIPKRGGYTEVDVARGTSRYEPTREPLVIAENAQGDASEFTIPEWNALSKKAASESAPSPVQGRTGEPAKPKNKGFKSSSVFMSPGEWARLKPSEQAAWRKRVGQLPEGAKRWLREAMEAGLDPREVATVADEMAAQDREMVEAQNAFLADARQRLGRMGSVLHFERYEEPGQIRGFDEVAQEMFNRYPTLLGNDPVNAEQVLFDMLKSGNRKSRSLTELYRTALDEVGRQRASQPEASETSPDVHEVAPGVYFSGAPIQITFLDNLVARGFPLAKAVRRWLTSVGDLPPEIFAEKVKSEGQVAAYAQDVQNAEKDLKRAVGRYDQLHPNLVRAMDAALKGDAQAMNALPAEVRPVLERMRQEVDLLSSALIQSGAVQGPLAATVEANKGVYLHRAYRVFLDPKWAEKVPQDVRNRFKSWLRAERLAEGLPASEADLEGLTRALLFNGTAAESPIAFLSRSKLGSKDLAVLTRRKGIPAELRALWGEHEDPLINYANSVGRMSHLLANHQFLTRVREQGLGRHFHEQPTPEHFAQIAVEGSETMKPLNGLYTTPEIKRAFEEAYAPQQLPDYLRVYMGALSLTKYAKTVGSPVTHIRNFLSNAGFALANGHWRADKAVPALKAFVNDTPEGRAYYRRLTELGVVGQGVHQGEFRDVVKDVLGQRDISAGEAVGMVSDRRIASWVRKGANLAEKLYQAEDAVWKTFAFENEKTRYREAYPEWSEAQLEQHAADIVRNTYPTYSLVPRAGKAVRRFPLVGPFVSFPAEVVRTTAQTARLAMTELADPRTRSIGAQRLAGLTLALTAATAVGMASRAMFGVDKDEEEAMRRFLPEWSRNSQLLHLGTNEKGERRYVDLSYTDPHAYLQEPVIAALRGDDVEGSARNAAMAVARPFVEEELLTKALVDIWRNQTADGRPVYNQQADLFRRSTQIAAHAGEPFVPGAYTSARRLAMSFSGTPEPRTGRVYEPGEEMAANVAGQRMQSLDVRRSMRFRALDFDRFRNDAVKLLTEVARSRGNVSDQELIEAYMRMEVSRRLVFDQTRKDVVAAQKLGMSRQDVLAALKDVGVSGADASNLLEGRYRPYLPGPEFLRPRSGLKVDGDLSPQELIRRRQIIVRTAVEASGRSTEPAAPAR